MNGLDVLLYDELGTYTYRAADICGWLFRLFVLLIVRIKKTSGVGQSGCHRLAIFIQSGKASHSRGWNGSTDKYLGRWIIACGRPSGLPGQIFDIISKARQNLCCFSRCFYTCSNMAGSRFCAATAIFHLSL